MPWGKKHDDRDNNSGNNSGNREECHHYSTRTETMLVTRHFTNGHGNNTATTTVYVTICNDCGAEVGRQYG